MRLGARGISLIQSFEKLRVVSYPDSGGVWTIGWGHTGKDVGPGQLCTREQADQWFREDTETAVRGVNAVVSVPLTQNQFDACVSFAFNVGTDIDADDIAEGFGDSTLLKLLNASDYAGAAEQFPRWNKVKGVVSDGLIRRRAAERALFLS